VDPACSNARLAPRRPLERPARQGVVAPQPPDRPPRPAQQNGKPAQNGCLLPAFDDCVHQSPESRTAMRALIDFRRQDADMRLLSTPSANHTALPYRRAGWVNRARCRGRAPRPRRREWRWPWHQGAPARRSHRPADAGGSRRRDSGGCLLAGRRRRPRSADRDPR